MVALGRLPAEAAKIRKNADRLYRQLKLAEYGWLGMIGRRGKDEFVRMSKGVMKDANLKYSKELSEVLISGGTPGQMAVAYSPAFKKAPYGVNPTGSGFGLSYSDDTRCLYNLHETLHGFEIKRNIYKLMVPKEMWKKIKLMTREELSAARKQAFQVNHRLAENNIVLKFHNSYATKVRELFKLDKRFQQIKAVEEADGIWRSPKGADIIRKKIIEDSQLNAYQAIMPEILDEMRKMTPDQLKTIKLQGLVEFQAIRKSTEVGKKWGLNLEGYTPSMNQQEKAHEHLNKWVRMVEKERRLTGDNC